MWPDLPKPATYAHNGKERFSPTIDRSINKLTNCHNTTATSWLVCFSWGLFLRPVRRPRVLGCSLSVTGWLVQAAALLKITTWLVHDVGHGFSYILWHFECNGASFQATSPRKLLSFAVTHHFVATHHPPPSTPIEVLVVLIKNNLKWRENQLAVDCAVGSLIAIK